MRLKQVVNELTSYQSHRIAQRQHRVAVEQREKLLGVQAHAVIDPGAMVVHHNNAATALITVIDVRGLEGVADVAFAFDDFVDGGVARDGVVSALVDALLFISHKHVKEDLLTLVL